MKLRSIQILFWITVASILPFSAFADEDNAGDQRAVQACLENWQEHPFKSGKKQSFRTLKATVKVLGIGGNIEDTRKTSKPELVLVKPAVNVLSSTTFKLMNPNGWYCFKANVTVLSKSTIKADCNAHIESSKDATTILGSNQKDHGGVTVLGKLQITRIGCKNE